MVEARGAAAVRLEAGRRAAGVAGLARVRRRELLVVALVAPAPRGRVVVALGAARAAAGAEGGGPAPALAPRRAVPARSFLRPLRRGPGPPRAGRADEWRHADDRRAPRPGAGARFEARWRRSVGGGSTVVAA